MKTTIPREGDCLECQKPVAAHFDSRNRKVSCADVASGSVAPSRRYFQAGHKRTQALRADAQVAGGVGHVSNQIVQADMTTEQTRVYLGRSSIFAVYRLVRECGLPRFRQGNAWRFSRQQVDTWRLQQQAQSKIPFRVGRGA